MSSQEIEIKPNSGFMQVSTLEQALKCADYISKSSLCPSAMQNRPGDILIALQMGQELGLKPMQAIQNIAVINGRPSLWGDAMLAVCRQSPDFEYIKEEYMPDTNAYVFRGKRRNEPEVTQSFSEADARLAKLWGKQGPWTNYPRRMLQMRSRGFGLRDLFPDLLRGIITAEEAGDINKEIDYSKIGTTVDANNYTVDVDTLIDEEKLSILKVKISEAGAEEERICIHMKIEKLELMNIKQFTQAIKMLDKKIANKKQLEELAINQWLNQSNDNVEEGVTTNE